jgi:hypothetical protein
LGGIPSTSIEMKSLTLSIYFQIEVYKSRLAVPYIRRLTEIILI